MTTRSDTSATPTRPSAGLDPWRWVPGVLAALGLVAVVYAISDVRGTPLHDVRVAVTTVFLLLGPGWALAGFVRARSMAERFVVAAGTGVALTVLAGLVMVGAGTWHPVGLLYLAAALTVPALARHAVQGR